MAVLKLARPKPKDAASAFADWLASAFVIPAGISAGQPFELHPHQLDFVRAFLERDSGSPRFRTLVHSLPRKTGKSTFMAALLLGLSLPDSPIYKPGFRGTIIAPTGRFAKFIPEAALAIMEAAGRGGEIRLKHAPSPGRLVIGKAEVQLLSGDGKSGHGDDVDLSIFDEAGLVPERQAELFDSSFNSLAARDGQQVLTGTRLDSPRFAEIIDRADDRTFVQLFTADPNDPLDDPETWAKATPGGFRIKALSFLRDAFEKAKATGTLEDFRTSHLNLPGNPARELLVTYDQLSACYVDDPQPDPGEQCWVGLDLGGSTSMTAACVVYESGIIRAIGAFPAEGMTLAERGQRDFVGGLYTHLADEGSLHLTSGRVTSLGEFLPLVAEMVGPHEVMTISADRYRREELLNALGRAGLSWPPVFRGQGPRDGDADVRATRKMFLSQSVKLKRSRLIEAGIAEADVKVHATGAVSLVKSSMRSRIDVCQALVLAVSALFRAKDLPPVEHEITVI